MEVGLEVVGPDQSLLHERGVRVAAGPPVSGRTQANKTEAIACTVYPRGVTNALRAAGATGPRSFKTHTHLCPGLGHGPYTSRDPAGPSAYAITHTQL